MPSYSRPGVFVNQSLTPLTASPGGVTGGAVATFVGAYNIGPTSPTLVTSWQNFVNLYGGFGVAGGSPLAYAVYQYFNNGGSGCLVYRVPNLDAVVASLVVASILDLTSPAAPAVNAAATGGTVAAGTYQAVVTYTDGAGETVASTATPVTATAATSTITITSPATLSGATGWYAYLSQAGGTSASATRQQAAGSPTAIGTNLTIATPPSSTGAAAPTQNTSGDNSLLTFVANSPGAWGNRTYVEIVPGSSTTNDSTSVFTLNIYQGGTTAGSLVETWPAVSLNPASTRNLVTLLNSANGGSKYVTAKVNFGAGGYVSGTGASDPVSSAGSPVALASGADGSTAPSLDTAITSGVSPTGNPDNPWYSPGLGGVGNQVIVVNIPAGPDAPITQSVVNNVISWAESQGNAFVVLDTPFGGVPVQASGTLVNSYNQYLTSGGSAINASPVVAMYGPWLSIHDPASSSPTATRWVAPGGAVLGVWARSDGGTAGVAQTPAGITATVSAASLETYFTNTDLGNLETYQVNPIKLIPGAGFCIFGGRTLASGYPNRYINVSRTLMQFTIDFLNITQFAIFRNNDAALWQSITTVLTGYLTQAMQMGMLAGTSPETSFAVICNDSTTSAAQAQAGIVNATVAVALVSPAEFVIINLSQMSGGGTATVSS